MTGLRLTGSRCQCMGCGDWFNSTSTFDRHRAGTFAPRGVWLGQRRCLTADALRAKGWARNAAGYWIERPWQAATVRADGPRATPAAPCGAGA